MSRTKNTGLVWLRTRMDELGYGSLEEVAVDLDINRGNLYRYFSLETKPSVAMLPPLCKVLRATPEEMLKALEVIGPKAKL
jgi:hypothetical protein